MNNPNAKTIPVKGYLSPDAYLALKGVFEPIGLSMSAAIGLSLQQLSASIRELDPAHRTRRSVGGHMPKPGLQRGWPVPGARRIRGGAPKPFMRV
jgi:hypothetical protein